MEQPLTKVVGASGLRIIYRAKVVQVRRPDDTGRQHSFWDKLLGVVTMAVVSAAGWAAIIGLIYLLK